MSQEKQIIEEMAHELCGMNSSCEVCSLDKMCLARNCADIFYNLGYRKQSEWISVEERLPEFEHWQTIADIPFPIPTPIKVLCALQTKDGYIIREGTYEINDGLHWFSVKGRAAGIVGITHWMPFPEPPKMKGGE